MLHLPTDIHTHDPERHDAVIQLEAGQTMAADGRVYSVGIHPWDTASAGTDWDVRLAEVAAMAADDRVVMVGEAGIDTLRGGPVPLQAMLLKRQAEIAEAVGKPLLLHVVKAWPSVLALHRKMRPEQLWIAHGFRGKPQLAKELLREGIAISLGGRFNADTAAMVPDGWLYTETDTSTVPIQEIVERISRHRP